jgi:hypothetical protein
VSGASFCGNGNRGLERELRRLRSVLGCDVRGERKITLVWCGFGGNVAMIRRKNGVGRERISGVVKTQVSFILRRFNSGS